MDDRWIAGYYLVYGRNVLQRVLCDNSGLLVHIAIKKYIITIAAVLVLLVLDTRSAAACSCALPATTRDALSQADVVFSGKVQSFFQVQEFNEDAGGLVVFSVDQAWKGTASAVVVVNPGYNAMSCQGYFWEQGQEYLVYAHRRANGTLGVHL